MATRSSIKNKSKLGTVASLAVGGVALNVDAGASDSLGSNSNALLESAFRLLEEGQNLFLSEEDNQALEKNRLKLEVTPGAVAGDSVELIPQFASAEAPVSDMVMTQEQSTDIVLAQASTAATTATETVATETAMGGLTSSGAGGSASASAAAAGAESAAIVAVAPLAGVAGAGFAATTFVAVAADFNSSSGGSDLNDDQEGDAASDSAKLFSLSGAADDGNASSGQSTNAGLIGGSNFIDDSTNSFFS
jgi:hypothetical protein